MDSNPIDTDDERTESSSVSNTRRQFIVGSAGALGGLAVGSGVVDTVAADEHQGDETGTPNGSESDQTPAWTVEAAGQIELNDANTIPIIRRLDDSFPGLHVWDTWPLRDRDGSVASVNGWSIQFALTSPSGVLPGKRHDIAEIRYFYSREGYDWHLGGPVFVPGSAKGNRQWAASAVWDGDSEELFMFYTATGRSGNPNDPRGEGIDITYEQRLALAEGTSLQTTRQGVRITGEWEHEIILTADGEYYQTQEQAGDGIIYAFRDPWYFEDPESGNRYLVFEGNTPLEPGEANCEAQDLEPGDYSSGVAATGAQFNGNIGLAVSTSDEDMSEWELRPPLLEAICVNQQLERGNIVVMDDRYYLFCDSHKFTFPQGLDGPDGMYGFVADSLQGDYEPLNGSGLVLANPADQPFQTYSWMPVPYDDNQIAVLSYYNYHDLGDDTLTGVGNLPREDQMAKFGGTFAPTLVVELDGASTEIVDTLDGGFLPSENSNPPIDTM
ncbi:glycoside hydrolase family 68 protein [Halobellus rarus]|uniref:Glycoside hydrolase family 68 protein n=1 Tax=Halobellus rarus TaxID=1126237 RepID=A0ABD6CUA6_9EURY